jgi:transposase
MELLSCLLPDVPPLHLETWQMDTATAQLTLQVQSTQTLVHCPVCRFPTRRIHSRYRRTELDLPWAQYRVVLQLLVRKFFCANRGCTRRIFTERLPGVVAPWARRTQRLLQWLAHIALALGGAAGAQLSCDVGVAVSRNTLLRLLRRLPVPSLATTTVWQRRSGQTLPVVAESPYQPLSPHRATWLVLRREETGNEGDAQQLAQLHAQHAEVAAAIDLAQDFAQLMRQRQPEELDPWPVRATTSRP